VADFNGDGKFDLAVANGADNTVSVFLGNGDGTFQSPAAYPVGFNPWAVAAGDFNRDGKLDLAVVNLSCPFNGGICSPATISILLGNGDGTFQPQTKVSTGMTPNDIVVGDFNSDGLLDLAVTDRPGSLLSGAVTIYLGNGDGTFKAGADFAVGVRYSSTPPSLAVGDFNGDGKLDVAAVDGYGTSQVSILLGNGDGTLQTQVQYTTGAYPYSMASADFNGDGKLDLAMVSVQTGVNTVSVLLGDGDGTFQPNVDYATAVGPIAVTLGDFNGDGKVDLAVSDGSSNTVSILLGNGDGTFQEKQDFSTHVGPVALVAADFDGDGRLDIATANRGTNDITLLLQAPFIAFSPPSLTFAATVGATSAVQTVTVTNSGGVPLVISSITLEGTNPGDFTLDSNCAATFAAGQSCTASVTFKPAAGGARSATLTLTDNAANSPQTVTLAGAGQDFAVSAGTSSATVTAGGSASYTLQLSPQGGFTGAVTLACSGAPSKSTCKVTPSSVTLDGINNAAATLMVTTAASSVAVPMAAPPPSVPPAALWLGLLGLLAVMGLAIRTVGRGTRGSGLEHGDSGIPIAECRRPSFEFRISSFQFRIPSFDFRRFAWLPLATLLLAVAVWASCGGGGGTSRTTIPGTPAGTYTLSVTATSGSLSNTTTVTLTVH
jgi:hypothetical protein